MKVLLLTYLTTVALAGQADYTKLQFAQFKEQFGKIYLTKGEHQHRFDIFQVNMKEMEEHNLSGASWKMSTLMDCAQHFYLMNQFSD